MTPVRVLLIASIGIALALFAVTPEGKRPNVLLITIDTLRADRLSCYGYAKQQTPAIDGLAADGVLFEHAYADVTWTTPSMASVMTGQYATHHGLRTSFQRLSQEANTLAEYLQHGGYTTAAIIGSFPLDSVFGLDQGFRVYDDTFTASFAIDLEHPPKPGVPVKAVTSRFSDNIEEMQTFLTDKATHDAYRPDNEVSDAAIGWLKTSRHEPFFLWVHYFGPHEKPQGTPDIFLERRIQLDRYDPDVAVSDTEVGRLLAMLDTLGIAPHTAVILHADHGQSLTEHGYFGHGRFVYDECQHVPLIMRMPKHAPGRRIQQQVRNLDIFPTVLELVGMAPATAIDGQSLLAFAEGGWERSPEETYVETYLSANSLFAEVVGDDSDVRVGFRRLGFRTPQWKYVVNDPVPLVDVADAPPIAQDVRARVYSEELYDLSADPDELRDVTAQHRNIASTFLKRIWSMQPKASDTSTKLPVGGMTRERLKALGYVD